MIAGRQISLLSLRDIEAILTNRIFTVVTVGSFLNIGFNRFAHCWTYHVLIFLFGAQSVLFMTSFHHSLPAERIVYPPSLTLISRCFLNGSNDYKLDEIVCIIMWDM